MIYKSNFEIKCKKCVQDGTTVADKMRSSSHKIIQKTHFELSWCVNLNVEVALHPVLGSYMSGVQFPVQIIISLEILISILEISSKDGKVDSLGGLGVIRLP